VTTSLRCSRAGWRRRAAAESRWAATGSAGNTPHLNLNLLCRSLLCRCFVVFFAIVHIRFNISYFSYSHLNTHSYFTVFFYQQIHAHWWEAPVLVLLQEQCARRVACWHDRPQDRQRHHPLREMYVLFYSSFLLLVSTVLVSKTFLVSKVAHSQMYPIIDSLLFFILFVHSWCCWFLSVQHWPGGQSVQVKGELSVWRSAMGRWPQWVARSLPHEHGLKQKIRQI